MDAATIVDRRHRNQERTWIAALLIGIFALHAYPFFKYASGDLHRFVIDWYRNIADNGWAAFAEPFGNYSPPYLYLLWITSLFDGMIGDHELLKLLSLGGAIWLALASASLLHTLNRPRWYALGVLLLPSIVQNTSFFGQADTFWVAPCVLALAAAVRERWFWVAFWSGLAFSFKAQAVFFAPFVMHLFLARRVSWKMWLVAPAVYVAAMSPAWLAGWPAWDLATVYLRQVAWQPGDGTIFVSNGASWWTWFGYALPETAIRLFWLGFASTFVAVAAYLWLVPLNDSRKLLLAAIISVVVVPFLLPGMHERFFLLADVLAFLYAAVFPSRRSIIVAMAMQIASALPVYVWAFQAEPLHLVAPAFAIVAFYLVLKELTVPAAAPSMLSAPKMPGLS